MEWDLIWGPREDGLLAVVDQTGETPKALENKPRLHEWLVWRYEAFWWCDSSRPIYDGSVGRIPITAILAFCEVFGLVETELRQSVAMTIRTLDSVYLKVVNTEIKRKVEAARKEAELEAERGSRGR